MAPTEEQQPLLHKTGSTTEHAENAPSDSDSSEDMVVDRSIDVFLSEHAASKINLGLDAGMSAIGTSISRRNSIVSVLLPDDDDNTKAATSQQRRGRRRSSVRIHYGSLAIPETTTETSEDMYGYGVSAARFRWIFLAMLFNWFVASFDSTLMASSHPVITSYFHASTAAAWLSTSFLITSTAFQPMFGRLSDSFGRRLPFIISMSMFILGTAFCGLAQSIVQFILARALCGFGAGGAMALGTFIVTDLIPLERRASYLAILNIGYGVGAMLGAALGGFLADSLGWRWEFGIQVPPLTICLLIAGFNLPADLGPCLKKKERLSFRQTMSGFDMSGSVVLTVCVTSLIVGLNLGGNLLPWDHPVIIAALVGFVILAGAFVYIEKKAARPIMPLYLVTLFPHTKLIFSNFFVSMTMNSVLFNVPLYFQGVLLDSPTRSGARLVIPFICGIIASSLTGYVINRTQTVMPCMAIGSIFVFAGTVLLTIMPSSLPGIVFSILMALTTLGQGLNMPTYSIGLLAITSINEAAAVMSTLFLFRNLGNILGIATSSLVVQNTLVRYLNLLVHGDDAVSVIAKVRQSVESIAHLPPVYRAQVIEAYAYAMRWTFGSMVVTAILAAILLVKIKLPKLGSAHTQGGHLEV